MFAKNISPVVTVGRAYNEFWTQVNLLNFINEGVWGGYF